MRMYQNTLFLILLAGLFTLSACSKSDEPTAKQKVAVLAQGFTFDDLSFLQSCKTGIEKAALDYKLDVVYDIDTANDKLSERVNNYGDQQYDLIIAIGFMWDQSVVDASKSYPESKFVLVDSDLSEKQPNALSILFDVDEAAYPLGFLCAWWADTHDSENPALAYVGAMEIPQIRQFTEAFEHGSSLYNQQYERSVAVYGNYAGDFFNQDLGKYLADSMINLGADVIFGVGSETGNGALLQAKESGKWGIGVDVDQYISYPEVSDILISSAMKGLDKSIYAVISSFIDESFMGSRVYTGKLSNEGVGLAPFQDYDALIPDSIKSEIARIEIGIIDNSISTGWE